LISFHYTIEALTWLIQYVHFVSQLEPTASPGANYILFSCFSVDDQRTLFSLGRAGHVDTRAGHFKSIIYSKC